MSLLQTFKRYISQNQLFNPMDGLLIAVSGGLDSVVLAELCLQANFNCTLAHCNFKLRGEESDRDEEFVRALAQKKSIPVLVKQFDTASYAEANKISIQVAARELRYQWFNGILDNDPSQLKYLLTAHHADDNAETVLMNFFKGTGIAGLHGILPKQNRLVRPLLFATRKAIAAFAAENNLQWVEDSSNESDKYTRNFFRQQLIPMVQSVYPEVISNLGDNAKRFREIELLYNQSIASYKKYLLEYRDNNEVHIPVLKLKKSVPLSTIVFEIMREFGFSPDQIQDIIGLLGADTGRYVQSASHRVIRNRNWLIIAPNHSGEQSIIVMDSPGEWDTPLGQIIIQEEEQGAASVTADNNTALLHPGEVQFPLILRKWKQGDYFYPLGMPHKKKIARFLIDQKLSTTEKENVWVLETNKKICWLVGLRIDDRFILKSNTKKLLRIKLLR